MRRPLVTSVSFASLALLLSPGVARANGRFPAAQQLALAPGDPNLIAMMATFGVNVSRDDGAHWDWVCETAIGYTTNENPVLGVTQSGAILIGNFEGLGVSTDGGCTWDYASSGIHGPVADLVVEKGDPHSVLVLASKYLGQDDAGSAFTSVLFASHDDGAHFAQVGANLDPDLLPETIEVAPSDATRVYVSGTRRIAGVATGVLLASTDGAVTFKETDFALATPGDSPFIAAVDPIDPGRLYVRVKSASGTRLLVSDDGAATTRQVWQATGDVLGFALSADGSKVYAGGPKDGLRVTTKQALDFTAQKWPGQVQCLAVEGNRLLGCSNEVSGFMVGASTDDGASWTPLLHLSCVRGPLACGSSSPVSTQCAPNWLAQQQNLGGPDPRCTADAGASDGGAPPPPPKPKGGSCYAADAVGTTSLPAGAFAVAALVAVVTRRRRARGSRT